MEGQHLSTESYRIDDDTSESLTDVLNNPDLLTEIITRLNPVRIIKSQRVSKFWYQIIARDHFWKKLCDNHHLSLDFQIIKAESIHRRYSTIWIDNEHAAKSTIVVSGSEHNEAEIKTFFDHAEYSDDYNKAGCYLVTQAEKYLNSVLAQSNSHIVANFGMQNNRHYISFLVSKLLEDSSESTPKQPRVLFLAPGAGLIHEITHMTTIHSENTNLRTFFLIGGVPISKQTEALTKGVDLLISTPSRTFEMLRRRQLDVSKLHYLVIEDERTLEIGFFRDVVERVIKFLPQENLRIIVLSSLNITPDMVTFAEAHMKSSVIYLNHQQKEDPHFEISGQFNSYKDLFFHQQMGSYMQPPPTPTLRSGRLNILGTPKGPSKYISVDKQKCYDKKQLREFSDFYRNGPIHPNLAAMPQVNFHLKGECSVMYENTSIVLADLIVFQPLIFTERLVRSIVLQLASAFEWLQDRKYYLDPSCFEASSVRANLLKNNQVQIKLIRYLPCFYQQSSHSRTDHRRAFAKLLVLFLTGYNIAVDADMDSDFNVSTCCAHLSREATDFVDMLMRPGSLVTLSFDDIRKHEWMAGKDKDSNMKPVFNAEILDKLERAMSRKDPIW